MLYQPGVSKSINLTLNYHTRITGFNPNHRFRVNHVIGWNTVWKKKTTPHQIGKAEGSGDLLQNPKSCMPPILLEWMGGRKMSSRRLPQPEAAGGAATWCSPDKDNGPHQEAHMPTKCKLWRVAVSQTPVVEPHRWTWQLHGNQNAESKHYNKHQMHDIRIGRRLNSER